jgi:regulatory protein YycI of two-component signal transduction system YycFG
MDWTKAKNILIIALLVTNLIIGAAYLGTVREKEREWEYQARSTASYLAALGVPRETGIPAKPV